MADRKPFPPPPGLARVAERDGTPTLAWSNWFGAISAWLQRTRIISSEIDWPSISAGATAFADVTVTNAVVGDFALASLDPTNADLEITAAVTAADTVRIWVTNRSAGSIDLAVGTTRIRLERAR